MKAQVQGDELRVSSKNRSDLQTVIALVKGKDLDFAVQLVNYRCKGRMSSGSVGVRPVASGAVAGPRQAEKECPRKNEPQLKGYSENAEKRGAVRDVTGDPTDPDTASGRSTAAAGGTGSDGGLAPSGGGAAVDGDGGNGGSGPGRVWRAAVSDAGGGCRVLPHPLRPVCRVPGAG